MISEDETGHGDYVGVYGKDSILRGTEKLEK